jgi:hypothetical protein
MIERGYIIHAQNTVHVDYVDCAVTLAHSLKKVMPNCSVSIMTDDTVNDPIFDNIIMLPYESNVNNMANDWQVYWASPYEHTIKLEADLFVPRNIDYWWDVLSDRDLNICTTIRNYKNQISPVRFYRKTIDDCGLVDTYNAITYFKKSKLAEQFYSTVADIFQYWTEYKKQLSIADTVATTDIVYGIAARIIGEEYCTLPSFVDMSMIHMKKMINGTYLEDWSSELLYEIGDYGIRINTFPALYPLHYHVKNFSATLRRELYATD